MRPQNRPTVRPALFGLAFSALLATPGVSVAQVALHRYSFTTGATDSIGGANGSLLGGANTSGGSLQLDGSSAYVSLPIGGTIASLGSSTFEAWVTVAAGQPQWTRIFDIGNDTTQNMFLTPRNGRLDSGPAVDTPRFAITTTGVGGEQQATSASAFPAAVETHVAVTIDATAHVGRLFVNGSPVATTANFTLTPSSLGTTANNWLGRSLYGNAYYRGSMNEFRIYQGALTTAQVLQSYQNGPNATPVPEPSNLFLAATALGEAGWRVARRMFRPDPGT